MHCGKISKTVYNINMKRQICILLLIFAASFIYAQNAYSSFYDDWERVFSENRKDSTLETYVSIFENLSNYQNTRVEWIVRLYSRKYEIIFSEMEEKQDVIEEKKSFNKFLETLSENELEELQCFTDYIKNNNLMLYDVGLEQFDLPIILTVSQFNLESYKYREKEICFEQMRVSVNNGFYDMLLISKESGNVLYEVRLSGSADEYTKAKLIELSESHQYANFYGYIEFFQKDRFCITAIR